MRQPRRDLAKRRRACGLTQEDLAHALEIDRSTVARWEAGETEPQPWLRRRLAIALRISTDQLATLLADPAPEASLGAVPIAAATSVRPDSVVVERLRAQVVDIGRR